jgi:hypothetical protein
MYLVLANHVFEDGFSIFTDQLRIYLARLISLLKWVQRWWPNAFTQARLDNLLIGFFLKSVN